MTTNRSFSILAIALCIVLALVSGMGCKHKPQVINPEFDPNGSTGNGPNDSAINNKSSAFDEGALPYIDPNPPFVLSDPNVLSPIYFDYDSSSLRSDAMATLRTNAANLKSQPKLLIQIAGHCDERGTQEYNVALGERRALAVRTYLIDQGVSGNRMITISYGEESPAVYGHDESAFAKNRRCEFYQAASN